MIPQFYFLLYITPIIHKDITEFYGQEFHDLVISLHKKYNNINILLERSDSVHNDDERFQNFEESIIIDRLCKKILDDNDIPYHIVKVGKNSVKDILKLL